jgi:D-alanyl-lipoteichoic acid acyltransferase DltB (MBOAT superfamily)
LKLALSTAGLLVTLQFVVLGWVWFALPDLQTAATVFLRLFGIGM